MASTPPRRGPDGRSDTGHPLTGVGLALLVIACCAGPVLIAAGALGALGAWLASPWVIAAAVVLMIAAVTAAVRRRSHDDSS